MNCNICNKPITSSGQAGAHIGCYIRANPPTPALDARDLVIYADDSVIAREIVLDVLNREISLDKLKIAIYKYNKRLMQQWQSRCDIYPEGT